VFCRWTQSCPRTGGALCARDESIPAFVSFRDWRTLNLAGWAVKPSMVSVWRSSGPLWHSGKCHKCAVGFRKQAYAACMLPYLLAAFAGCFALERMVPGWPLPRVRTWPFRVVLVNLVQLGVVLMAGVTWERWFSSASLFHLREHLSPSAGGMLAYFIATFIFYWWHRWRHRSDTLWRLFHQIHHSAQRIEVITSFYKHPLEMVVNSIIGSVLVYSVMGLSLKGGAIYTACTALGEFFYHTNVKTPRWVGYIFQRPEMHRIPSRVCSAPQQLWRHRLVGHALWHLRKPEGVHYKLRL